MDVNKLAADAGRLSIPQLQQAMRDGTLPPYIGMPVLQEKVKLQKQMQAAQAAGQPKAPTVAEQVEGAAQQANIEDMMKARAAAMQDEMGQTGGISDFLPKPAEEAYAKGGPIAFAARGLVPGETMAEQLERLLAEQKAADYGWTEEAASAYKPKYYQTPEEARASLSRRGLVPTEQPMTLEDLQQAQARARAQTGLGIRSGEAIEIPPYREPVSIKAPQAAPPTGLSPYQYTGDVLGSTQPIARPVIGLLPDYSPVIEGRSFAHPTTTPRADMEAAKAYYAENIGKRPMNAGQAFEQEMGAKRAAEDAQLNRAGKIAQFEGDAAKVANKTANLKALGGYGLGTAAALSLPSYIADMAGGDPREFVSPERRKAIEVEDIRREEKLKRLGHIGVLLESLGLKTDEPDAYVGASERVAPKTQSAQAPLATTELPQGFKDMASRIAAGKQTPRASFDFANPNQVATDVLANPARANTDPDLWQWASDYRAQNPIKTPYVQTEQPVAQQASVAAQTPAQSQGLAALYDEAIGQNPITTAEQARQRREAYLGPNTGIASLREDIGKMKSEAAEDKERAPWMALMKAGLATMAGTSPFALTNIGKGAQEGVADYMAAQKDYRHAQEKQLELNTKLDAAERQEKIDAYKFGEDSEKASRSANTALKIGKATAENKAELDRAELDLKKESNSIMRQHYADLNDKYDTAASGVASGLRGDINNKNALKALDQSLDTKLKDLREQYKTGALIGQDIRQDERYIDIMNKKNAVQQKLAALAGIGKEAQTTPPPAKDYSLADKLSGYGR